MIRLLIRLIIAFLLVYFLFHYFDVYAYIDSSYIPDFLEGFIDFAQDTAPRNLFGEVVSFFARLGR
ncbi:MAG: hypothetical protein QGH85_01420 [Candidatus Pacebacteria bacterium]|jgi:hypothetical protein|nr:hypothetical protein [Candidatus Paceibacterota bacterium]MDP7648433.1 hypothetical protein [Candidatus Paceibacterota bacterium]HJO89675.1 hypothetical protein [Candidatus Paceibacterota bacterium]